ncbi:MAG TPA: hypothetical protein EYN06_01335 [Myxococcales bacterium]|nr:hypothetical protein [Myxococcales bacterium]HIN85093.1 hypothetical protein [Myxococcales bacterium]
MAECCGGKNAGKPISWKRYLSGLGVFLGYHGSVTVALHVLSVPFPQLKKVRNFQRTVFTSELKEILKLEDINVNGRLDDDMPVTACEMPEDVRTVVIEDPDKSDLRSVGG